MSGSNPPSTPGSARLARRALLTSAMALGTLALPVCVVVATAEGSSEASDPVISASSSTSSSRPMDDLVEARSASSAVRFGAAAATPAVVVAPTTTTVPPAPPTTAPPAPAPIGGDPNDPASWDRLASCESGGNWAADTGNGYYGGLQFSLSSWQSVGGTGYPHQADRATQIAMGQRLYAQGGWDHWPACTRSFGWR